MQLLKLRQAIYLIAFSWIIPTASFAQDLDPILKDLIAKGLDKSHEINILQYDAKDAQVDQKLAKTVFIPKVTLNGSFTRLNDDIRFDGDTENLLLSTQKLLIKEAAGMPFNAPFPSGIPLTPVPSLQNKNILKSSVGVDWVLFSGFKASNALKASRHKEASINYLTDAEKDKLAIKIIETYDKLALVNASERVLGTTQQYLDEQSHFVKKAIERGLATPIGRKKIELAQQQLDGKFLEFQHNRTLLIELLHQLTNENKENLALLNPELKPLLVDSAMPNERRSELKALEEAEQATLYKAKMEKNNFIPKVALQGHYEFLEDDLSLLDPKWYVGVGVKWNVFSGFQSNLNSEKARIESLKYREQRENAEELMELNVIKAELALEAALKNIKLVEKEIEIAQDTYELVDKQYKNNLASINDVLDALNDLEKANFKLQESYLNQRKAGTDLLHAKGILNHQY